MAADDDSIEESSGEGGEQSGVESMRSVRRRKVLQTLWYSLGVASAVTLVAVVGTQIIQGGGYDQKQRELEQSHSESVSKAKADESAKIAAATKYATVADMCELVGKGPYAETFGSGPDEVESRRQGNSSAGPNLMVCIMKTEDTSTYEEYKVTISAWQYNDVAPPKEAYQEIKASMSERHACADIEVENCLWTPIESRAVLVAHDYNLRVQVYVDPPFDVYKSMQNQELAGVLTEYAQLTFDGLWDE